MTPRVSLTLQSSDLLMALLISEENQESPEGWMDYLHSKDLGGDHAPEPVLEGEGGIREIETPLHTVSLECVQY